MGRLLRPQPTHLGKNISSRPPGLAPEGHTILRVFCEIMALYEGWPLMRVGTMSYRGKTVLKYY